MEPKLWAKFHSWRESNKGELYPTFQVWWDSSRIAYGATLEELGNWQIETPPYPSYPVWVNSPMRELQEMILEAENDLHLANEQLANEQLQNWAYYATHANRT